jgi:hypothetical protein
MKALGHILELIGFVKKKKKIEKKKAKKTFGHLSC